MSYTASIPEREESQLSILPAAAFTVVTCLTTAPLLSHLYLPLIDLPNHIARHYLETPGSAALQQYYEYTFQLVPNSAVDILWTLTGGLGDPVRFSQIAIAFSTMALVAATMILFRVLWGTWSAWPASIGLLAYHASFLWGFENYVFSLPFVLTGFALWLSVEDRNLRTRLAVFTPYTFVLFLMHFFAFAGFAVMVFGRELQKVVEERGQRRRHILHASVMALPFLSCIGYLVADVFSSGPSPAGSLTHWGDWHSRIEALGSLTLGGELTIPQGLRASGAVTLVLCGVLLMFFRRNSGARLALHPKMRGPILALCVLVLAAPFWLNGVAFVHIRFPILLSAALFAASCWKDLRTRDALLLGGAVLALILVRAVQFDQYAARHDKEVRAFIDVVKTLPAGSRLLPVRAPNTVTPVDQRLWHVAGYAVTRADVFVPTLFQGVHGLKVREEWRNHSTPALYPAPTPWLDGVDAPDHFLLRFVVDWREKYTHAIMIDPFPELLEPYQELVETMRRDRFTLYEIR